MAIYTSFDELNGKTLQMEDIVFLAGVRYGVRTCFLHSPGGVGNSAVFDALSIPEGNMHILAADAYGYANLGGDWPQSRYGDYEALTRLVLVLLAFIEGEEVVSIKMPGGEWRTFKSKDYRISNYLKSYMQVDERCVEVRKDYVIMDSDGAKISFEEVKELLSNMSRTVRRRSVEIHPDYTGSYTRYTLRIGCQQIPKKQIQNVYNHMIKLRKK